MAILGACALLFVACGPQPPAPSDFSEAERAALLVELASVRASDHRAAVEKIVAWAHPDLPWLCALLQHDHRGVREGVAHALGDLSPRDPEVVRALLRAFEDADDYVRWKAARALGNIGDVPIAVRERLQQAAKAERETEVVRAAAQRAVEQIDRAQR